MRGWGLAMAAAALVAAAPAAAQAIALKPGEAVTIHVTGKDSFEIVNRGPAVLNDYDKAVIREIGKGSYADAPTDTTSPATVSDEMPDPPEIRQGVVKLSLVAIPNNQFMLIVENGYPQALKYRARLLIGDRTGFANVCLVKPVRGTYEHWPFKVDSTEIVGIELREWQQGDAQPCEE
ncbi:hypothetical protein OF829_05660 [Sphingomonas sp. LB-2]|uniref:hypothetical protein n=1 Tax=Sphingomonas caeni TaxID=2984949 RepID=UPI002231C8FB|nr:hypothetical protein [Sphingomonas caeni]MCW3846717.1 hypothetical protein [Sphingomonas caeni]